MRLRVVKPHEASFNYSVSFKKGDTVKVDHEDPEMPGWYWCENDKGVWSWVPEEYMVIKGRLATITHEYDTAELTVEEGELLESVTAVHLWTLCRNRDRKQGWVPTANLEEIK